MNTIYTIGYTGIHPEQLRAAVQTHNLMVLDVRLSPRSRRVEWTGARLRALLEDRYLHVPAFGNINYKGDGPIQISAPATGLLIARLHLEQQSILLLCACRDVETCHRRVVADLLAEATSAPVIHWRPVDMAPTVPLKDDYLQLKLW